MLNSILSLPRPGSLLQTVQHRIQRYLGRVLPEVSESVDHHSLRSSESKKDASWSSDDKVVHVTRRFSRKSWGGMETRVLELCREQQKNRAPKVVSTSIYEEPGSDNIEALSVERFGYHYPVLGLPEATRVAMDQVGGNLVSWGLFQRILREPKLKLVHAHCTKRLGSLAWLASVIRGVPFVVTLHGDVLSLPSAQQERFDEQASKGLEWGKAIGLVSQSRRLLERADAVIAVGRVEYEALVEKLGSDKVHFVPGGVDYQRFSKGNGALLRRELGISQQAPLLTQVGRIDPQKNQIFSVELLHSLHQQGIHAHLLCVGPVTDQAYQRQLLETVERLGIQRVVHFLELDYKDPRLQGAFHAADVVLQPSLHEPFGLTVLEAWCASTPVLASNIGGLRELVQDGQGGFSLSPKQLAEWTFRTAWLLRNQRACFDIGQKGLAQVLQKYLWSHVSERMDSIYASLLNS